MGYNCVFKGYRAIKYGKGPASPSMMAWLSSKIQLSKTGVLLPIVFDTSL
jgi:hypothetical protein